MSSEDAAVVIGVSGPVGSRWFRQGGGMPPISLSPLSGRYLSFGEREEIALLLARGESVREISRQISRSPSTVSREIRRNTATRSGRIDYRASVAQWKAELMARRLKVAKMVSNPKLGEYVKVRLAGSIRLPDGSVVTGPAAPLWKGRNKPRRQDRTWTSSWSPEQIANRLRLDFPDDPSMRISHESIYQALYVPNRGALDRNLVTNLRTGRALRVPRARSRNRAAGHVTEETTIGRRPPHVADRLEVGHLEGDLIIGTSRSAIGTLVERMTRFTILVHLPRLDGWGDAPTIKNGPALGGYGAEAMRIALGRSLKPLPLRARRTLTWDRGKELAQHIQLKAEIGIDVYFADPHSPWQRGTNENMNGLLRQYFPKGTDLSRWSADELAAVAAALNARPRKCLGWRTPAEALEDQIRSLQ